MPELTIQTRGQGLHECTEQVQALVASECDRLGLEAGLATVFIQHTSASLTIQENADPSAARDLEAWLDRLVPEHDALYTHTAEGPDDMPAHIKAILTDVSLSIPVARGRLALGTWQGVYVWEHRARPHARRLVVHVCP
mgnify:CR=1 FL=1